MAKVPLHSKHTHTKMFTQSSENSHALAIYNHPSKRDLTTKDRYKHQRVMHLCSEQVVVQRKRRVTAQWLV